jgi:hypothetical protein
MGSTQRSRDPMSEDQWMPEVGGTPRTLASWERRPRPAERALTTEPSAKAQARFEIVAHDEDTASESAFIHAQIVCHSPDGVPLTVAEEGDTT